MLIKQIILDHWLWMPFVSLTCEALRWAAPSPLKKSSVRNHWIHTDRTPRLGGVCIFFTLFCAVISLWDGITDQHLALTIFAATVPIFMIGFVEDVFPGGSAVTRLLLSSFVVTSSCCFIFYFHYVIGVNEVSFYSALLVFIFLCLSGVSLTHGANLIDGSNGLCVFWGLGAIFVLWICLFQSSFFTFTDKEVLFSFIAVFCFCLTGFLFVNFPYGRVFLGDSGAYLIGFFVFSLGAVLIIRSPDIHTMMRVSAAFSYPIMEVGCTVLRRVLIAKSPIFCPDNGHLHSLLHKNIRGTFAHISRRSTNNYASVLILFFVIVISMAVSVFLPADPLMSAIVWMLCPASYLMVYGFAFFGVANADAKQQALSVKNQY